MQKQAWIACGALAALMTVSACSSTPRDSFVQWVARDAWNPACADKAIVERWVTKDGHWKVDGQVWVVDVDATFKLGNDCTGDGGATTLRAYESMQFRRQGLEISRCTRDGQTGWSLPGKEETRCWTGPSLITTP